MRSIRLAEVWTPQGRSGLTLVEVLMSLMVTGIGILGVVALLPLAFVRAVQATNLTNGTILRYDAESMIDISPRLLLRWQAQQAYSNATPNYTVAEGGAVGDLIINPSFSYGFRCTTSGTSGAVQPTWNPTLGGTTNDGTVVWTTMQIPQAVPATPIPFPPTQCVIDPMGWYANSGTAIQTTLGNTSPAAAYPNAIPRFSGQLPNSVSSMMQTYLPDSWVEQARSPVTSFTVGTPGAPGTPGTATLSNVDLSSVAISTEGPLATATPPYVISRVVLIDATGKNSQTRIVTGVNAATTTVSWNGNDPLTGNFTPVMARVETQESRYTWLLTLMPSNSAGGPTNVEVTVFFNRALTPSDEQAYTATGADGVQTPFTVTYSGQKPFAKKGGFLFDCVFGRWYRIVNVVDVSSTQFNVFVDQSRPSADLLTAQLLGVGQTFGAVFMRGIVDVFPLSPKS
jgi:Tfp pilus assembly protein PilV